MTDETDIPVTRLHELAIAVLADRLYILGSDQWADPELIARWYAEVTPATVLRLLRVLNTVNTLREAVQTGLTALIYHTAQTRPIHQTDTAINILRAVLGETNRKS